MLTNDELAKWDRENFFHPSTHLAQFARGDAPQRIVTGGEGSHITDRDGNPVQIDRPDCEQAVDAGVVLNPEQLRGHGGIQLLAPRGVQGIAHDGPHPRARSQPEPLRTSAKRRERGLSEVGIELRAAPTTTLRAAVTLPHSLRISPTGVHLGVGLLLHLYARVASSSRVGRFAGAHVLPGCLRGASGPLDPLEERIAFGAHAAPPISASGTSGLRTASPPSSSATAPSASCSAEVSGP